MTGRENNQVTSGNNGRLLERRDSDLTGFAANRRRLGGRGLRFAFEADLSEMLVEGKGVQAFHRRKRDAIGQRIAFVAPMLEQLPAVVKQALISVQE